MKTSQKRFSAICLLLPLLSFSVKSIAQVKAAFTASKNTISCPSETIYFSDQSTGNPVSWSWNFGDNTSSNLANPSHQYARSGRYTVSLIVRDATSLADTLLVPITVSGPTVQYTKTIDTSCSTVSIKFVSKATGIGPLSYTWDFGDGKTSTTLASAVTHVFKGASSYPVNLTVKDTSGCSAKVGENLVYGCIAPVLPTSPNMLIATRECNDQFGWTNYYNDNNTPANIKDDILLLSIYKAGKNIGRVGDGTFEVKVGATAKAGTSESILLKSPVISNPSGYYVMNRYWSVQPTIQPSSPVGVRFYFNNQDIADINGTFPTHDADFPQLIFYKTKDGSPDPSTSLSGASDIISIYPGSEADETHWTYTYIGAGSHLAEFSVADFSGGGGGGITVNNETLPVKLISFTGKPENGDIRLNWLVTSEINVEKFEIERSTDGATFTKIGSTPAKGSNNVNNYSFTDVKVNAENAKFYRLVTVDKDGKRGQSHIIKVLLAGATNAISVYPVPANNNITISSKTVINKNCSVQVYNSLGLRVTQVNKTASGNSFQVNTSNLPNGTYRAVIFSNNEKIGDANFIILR